jgi:hypothetical protein
VPWIISNAVSLGLGSAPHPSPEATEHQADADRDQDGLQRLLDDGLLDSAHDALDFVVTPLIAPRGILTQFPELFPRSVACNITHFLKVFRHDLRLFAQSVTRSRHQRSPFQKETGQKMGEHKRLLTPFFPTQKTKKADVAEHPKMFDHVGLLVNEPSRKAGLLFA